MSDSKTDILESYFGKPITEITDEELQSFIGSYPSGPTHYRYIQKGIRVNYHGYTMIRCPEHPKAMKGFVPEHILVAEKALGKYLPNGAEIHHANEYLSDNKNLVICQDKAYHHLVNTRTKAFRECGHAKWRKCYYCHQYDDPVNMYVSNKGCFHRSCKAAYYKNRRTAASNIKGNIVISEVE